MDLEDAGDTRLPFERASNAANSTMPIIGAEDEEFENDIGSVDDTCSHFQCMDLLKDRPTYLIIFLHHVILQFDASSVLCYLHGEMFKGASVKDTRRMFMDFFHTFLDRSSVLRVSVPPEISFELDRSRPDVLLDESMRNIVKGMQRAMNQDIYTQLDDFRNKRMMGMTIGEKELSELDSDRDMDREAMEMKEKFFAEQLLPKVEEATANTDDEKSTAIYNAVVTYMKFLGVKTKEPRVLEKKRHFLMRRKGPNPRKENEPVKAEEKKRKGIGSILDLRRQTRTDPSSSSDPRVESVKQAIDRKNSSHSNWFQSDSLTGKHRASVEVSEVPGPSVSGSAPSKDEVEGETVHTSSAPRSTNDNQSFRDMGESSQRGGTAGESQLGGDGGGDDGADSESVDPGGIGGPDSQQSFLPPQSEDNVPCVPELETEPPSWRLLVNSELLLRLKKSEVKRQEVINELFITEHAHVRMLRVLYEVFYQRMLVESILTDTELQSIFPSLDELIEVHASFYEQMKKIRQDNGYLVTEIGNTLLAMFHGTEGDWFKKLASRFCILQSIALELIKQKNRTDPRFRQFIQDAQSNPQCRRLQLKDIIPIEMQRLTKYPLLLENIAKCTDQAEEKQRVLQAAECCRNILKDVNQKVKDTENMRRLHDYQRRLDLTNLKQSTDPFVIELVKNLDLSQKQMIHEGPLIWRLTKEKAIDVHVLLLSDSLILMQKVDDRMVLKCHSKNSMSTLDGKQMCPIIRLGSVLARDVATDCRAFFILFQMGMGAQIYELVAQTMSEKRSWCDKIQNTQDALKLQRPSMMGRNSLVPPQGNIPLSPTESMMNSENGFSSRDRISSELSTKESDGVSQDSEAGQDTLPLDSLAQLLTENLKANDVDLFKLTSGPLERWADQALQDVHNMQWELSRSKRTSKEPPSMGGEDPRVEAATDPERPAQGVNASEGAEVEEAPGDAEDPEDWDAPDRLAKLALGQTLGGEADPAGTPVVLSQEQAETMERKMNSLLVKMQHLKAMEDDYFRMRQVLVDLTMPPRRSLGNYRRVSGERW